MLYSNTNSVASGCHEAYRLHEQLKDASTTMLQQSSIACRSRTCLFMGLHRRSTNHLSKTKSRKHYHYPKRHSTHTVVQRIFHFAQRTTVFGISLRARRNRKAWTYQTPISFLHLDNLVAVIDRFIRFIRRWYNKSTGSRRRRRS
jgi:hypothetical protein